MSKDYSLEELEELEEKQRKKDRSIFMLLILALGIGGLLFNGYIANTRGLYSRILAVGSPAVFLFAIYSLLFPRDFSAQDRTKLSPRMWIAIILGLPLCVANLFAFEYGLY